MGQYFLVANIDKQQYLYAHKFWDGLKLGEFGPSGSGTMAGLAYLLADNSGLGDWVGDRIVICGDYGPPGEHIKPAWLRRWRREQPKYGEGHTPNLYQYVSEFFTDISTDVIIRLCEDDGWFRDHFREMMARREPIGFKDDELERLKTALGV